MVSDFYKLSYSWCLIHKRCSGGRGQLKDSTLKSQTYANQQKISAWGTQRVPSTDTACGTYCVSSQKRRLCKIKWLSNVDLGQFQPNNQLHDFSVIIPRCYKDIYVNSFFPRAARLWNSLPTECFPLTYNLNGFKSRINRHLLTVGSF